MNRLNELLQQIKSTLNQNNIGLENSSLLDLSQRVSQITQHLERIEQTLDRFTNHYHGIEVAPEDLQQALGELNLTANTGASLRTKLAEILQLATDDHQELATKIQETESELEQILSTLQQQQQVISHYKDNEITLESRVKVAENQAQNLHLKAGLIGGGMGLVSGSCLVMLARYLRMRK